MDIDLATLPVQHLLTLDRQILNELRQRQIVRTGNSPVGDWAELLVAKAFGDDITNQLTRIVSSDTTPPQKKFPTTRPSSSY